MQLLMHPSYAHTNDTNMNSQVNNNAIMYIKVKTYTSNLFI